MSCMNSGGSWAVGRPVAHQSARRRSDGGVPVRARERANSRWGHDGSSLFALAAVWIVRDLNGVADRRATTEMLKLTLALEYEIVQTGAKPCLSPCATKDCP